MTAFDKLKNSIKNNIFAAIILVVVSVVIGASQIIDAGGNIKNY